TVTSTVKPTVSMSDTLGPQYTSTYTTTKPDGSVETECIVVIVTTDAAGSLTTRVSTMMSGYNSESILTRSPEEYSLKTSTSTAYAASVPPDTSYTIEVVSTLTTVVFGPSSSLTTMVTYTLTACINCDYGELASESAYYLSTATDLGPMSESQTSSISTFNRAASSSRLLGMVLVPLLAILL
ncbi:hypothetical protein METBIDRAFT_33905, partial [Metschnikowia bicuspidata var. bicuspidata NRRL YB-4993]